MKLEFLVRNAATIAGGGFIISNLLQIGSAKERQNPTREIASHMYNVANVGLLVSGAPKILSFITPPHVA